MLAALLAAFAVGACDDSATNVVCPNAATPAVLVRVVDGFTQQRVELQVTGTWSTGAVSDSLRHLGTGAERYLGAFGPAGTYTVRLQRPGSVAWELGGIVVPDAICGPQTQELTVTLARA
jgi:hypothetical protein